GKEYMRGLPLLLFSFFVGYSVTILGALKNASATDASMHALLAAIISVPIGVLGGCVIALIAIHVFGLDFASPKKYQIIAISYGVTYVYFCWRYIRKGC